MVDRASGTIPRLPRAPDLSRVSFVFASKNPEAPRRGVTAYIRVSTGEQALGLAAQRAAIEAWVAAQGGYVVAWCVDEGVSGAAPLAKRPGLVEALAAAGKRGTIVVARRDRLARDPLVALLAERAVGAIVCADQAEPDGPAGELMRRVLDATAAFERALIRERVRAALAVKRARGERTGALPLGARVGPDGLLEVDPAERAAIERIGELRAGGLSIRRIAQRLNAEGVPARGSRWHHTSVDRVLRGRAQPDVGA